MKIRIILFIFFSFSLQLMRAQSEVVDVIDGLSFPYGVEIEGNTMYISDDDTGIIYSVDLSTATPTATPILTGLIQPRGMEVVGNDLYFTNGFEIQKVDLTQTPLVPTTVVDVDDGPNDLVFYKGELYASLEETDKIVKFDISQSNPTIDTLVDSDLSLPLGMDIADDVLYVSEFLGGEISKINLDQTSPSVEGFLTLIEDAAGIIVEGGYIYFTMLNTIDLFMTENEQIK